MSVRYSCMSNCKTIISMTNRGCSVNGLRVSVNFKVNFNKVIKPILTINNGKAQSMTLGNQNLFARVNQHLRS